MPSENLNKIRLSKHFGLGKTQNSADRKGNLRLAFLNFLLQSDAPVFQSAKSNGIKSNSRNLANQQPR
jgi:hypothetical protein